MSDHLQSEIRKMQEHLPELTRRADFDAFWQETLEENKTPALNVRMEKQDYPSPYVDVYHVTYAGFHGVPIRAWLLVPAFLPQEKLPCLIQYHGFGNHKGWPAGLMHWVMMGLCVLAPDARGQSGESGNEGFDGGSTTNLTTCGILNRYQYYYRGLYMDALRALDVVGSLPFADPGRIIVRGISQGGALSLAVSALDKRPSLALASVPSNCEIERRVEGRYGAFSAVNDYLRKHPDQLEQAYETLSYFDLMNMAERITCPVCASVALEDKTCPALCFYAAYNRILSPKEITHYPFNEHEGAREFHLEKELKRIRHWLDESR